MSTDTPNRRRLPYDAFTHCWYVAGETHIVDLIHPDDGLTLYAREDAGQVQARHPDAQRMSCDDAFAAIEAVANIKYKADVVEITAEHFHDALNVLPPVGWTTRQGVESFRISERIWGNITDIYAHAGQRYFKLSDDIRLSPDSVAARVLAFIATHPLSDIGREPERPVEEASGRVSQAKPTPGGDA